MQSLRIEDGRVWSGHFIFVRDAGTLSDTEFLEALELCYQIGYKGKLVWTEKVQHRFKEQVREWERSGHRVSGGEPREG